jgi:NADPH:quinone reductase
MPHAMQIRQTGGPGKVCVNVNQRFALKDAANAHKTLEARATSGSTILTI